MLSEKSVQGDAVLYERHLTEDTFEALRWSPVVLVEGPRQAGKSVLVRELIGSHRSAGYVTLDDALALSSARADAQGFVFALPDPVTLDEIQRAPELLLPIKLSVDRDREPGRFLLAGSANVLLLPAVADALTGRMRIVTLLPLSQGEIDGEPDGFVAAAFADGALASVEGTQSRTDIAARIVRGGFPEAVGLPAGSIRSGWMRAYLTTLIERDIREIAAISDRVALPRLLQMLATRNSTVINVSEISRATGIARATLDRYVSLLTKTFTVRLVEPWAGDVARRLVRAPKLLFIDPGLSSELSGLDADRLSTDPNALGPALEGFVGAELLKQVVRTPGASLLHFRDQRGHEVDWVLEDAQGRLVGIEVKATTAPDAADFAGLRAFANLTGARFHRGIVLHTGTTTVPMGERMWSMPVEALWREG